MAKDNEVKNKLEKLKEKYSLIQKKHGLPDFNEMNSDFQIERITEVETDHLIREVRKFMNEKFANYLRFTETILNPVNVPMFVYSIVKTIKTEDRSKIAEVYTILSKNEIDTIELDLNFDEDKEVKFVKRTFKEWQEIKETYLKIIETVKNNFDKKFEVSNNGKGYFG